MKIDYKKEFFCSKCRHKWSHTIFQNASPTHPRCPICHLNLRTKPRKSNGKLRMIAQQIGGEECYGDAANLS